jgi:hypothetical protein
VARKNTGDDDSDPFDFIETSDDCEDVECATSVKDNTEARRRLEKILEDKALERLINDDF